MLSYQDNIMKSNAYIGFGNKKISGQLFTKPSFYTEGYSNEYKKYSWYFVSGQIKYGTSQFFSSEIGAFADAKKNGVVIEE